MKNQKIGPMIKKHRVDAGLTQMGLAKKLGFNTPQFISLVERGLAKAPADMIGKLSVLIGIDEKKILRLMVADFRNHVTAEIRKGKSK